MLCTILCVFLVIISLTNGQRYMCQKPLDIVFILDRSSSLRDKRPNEPLENWYLLRNFTKDFIDNFDVHQEYGARFGMVSFATTARDDFLLDRYPNKDRIFEKLTHIPYGEGGRTNWNDALELTREQQFTKYAGDRSDVPNIVIFVADGPSTVNYTQTDRVVEEFLADSKIDMAYSVYITHESAENEEALWQRACHVTKTRTGSPAVRNKDCFKLNSFEDLSGIVEDLVTVTCFEMSSYIPSVCSPSDLTIIMDSSADINRDDWNRTKYFVHSILSSDYIEIANTAQRVSVIQYTSDAIVTIPLDNDFTKSELLREILRLNVLRSTGSNLPAAFDLAASNVFTIGDGDRQGIRNIVLVVSAHKIVAIDKNTGAELDDQTTYNRLTEAASFLRTSVNARIYAVGLLTSNSMQMMTISSSPQRPEMNYWMRPSTRDLSYLTNPVQHAICSDPAAVTDECGLIDIALLLDGSGSIRQKNPPGQEYDNWELLLEFAVDLVDAMPIGKDLTRVGVVLFGNSGSAVFHLNEYYEKELIIDRIRSVEYLDQNTNTSGGIKIMRKEIFNILFGDRPNVPNIAIVITDGISNRDKNQTIPQAELAHKENITIHTIGITDDVDENELKMMASEPRIKGKQYFTSPDFRNLDTLLGPLVNGTCEVALGEGYSPRTQACNVLDVVYILDSSLETPVDSWELMRDFIADSMDSLTDVAYQQMRVAIIQYSDRPTLMKGFDETVDQGLLNATIREYEQSGRGTNTARALRFVKEELFDESRGDRPFVANSIVLLVDNRDTIEASATEVVAQELKDIGTQITTIGIKDQVDKQLMERLSSPNQEENTNYFYLEYENLYKHVGNVTMPMCFGFISGVCRPLDVTIIIDSSLFLFTDSNYEVIKGFAAMLISSMNVGRGDDQTRVAFMKYSAQPEILFKLDSGLTKEEMLKVVADASFDNDNANIRDAISMMRRDVFSYRFGDRPLVDNIAIIIATGPDLNGMEGAATQSAMAHDEQIRMYSIGVGSAIFNDDIEKLSSPPHVILDNYFMEEVYNDLGMYSYPLLTKVCESGSFDPEPALTINEGVCRRADFAFLVDGSSAVGEAEWLDVKEFMIMAASGPTIGPDNTHIAVVVYSDEAYDVFDLDEFDELTEITRTIRSMSYPAGGTRMVEGLEVVLDKIFARGGSSRSDAPNILMTIASGESDHSAALSINLAETLRRNTNTRIVGVAVNITNPEEISRITSYGQTLGQDWFRVNFASELLDRNFARQVMESACSIPETTPKVQPTTASPPTTATPPSTASPSTAAAPTTAKQTSTPRPSPTTVPSTVSTEKITRPPIGAGCQNEIDIVLIMDSSGSIIKDDYMLAKNFYSSVVSALDVENGFARVAFVVFSTSASVIFHLDRYNDRRDMLDAIDSTPYEGGATNTGDTLRLVREDVLNERNGKRNGVRTLVIIMTDGGSNNKELTVSEALMVKTMPFTTVLAIGVGDWTQVYELQTIASHPYQQHLISLQDYMELNNILRDIQDIACNSDDSCGRRNPCLRGTCVDTPMSYECECNRNYGGTRCDKECSSPPDIVFIVDASGSVHENRFVIAMDFVKGIANDLPTYSGGRAALITFSDDKHLYFDLDDYDSKSQVLNGMSYPFYTADTTNTASAINHMLDTVFDRSTSRNDKVAIIITDGRSDNQTVTWQASVAARSAGVHMVAIGVGGNVDRAELYTMASYPASANTFVVSDYDQLVTIHDIIVDTACNNVNECDLRPCGRRGQCIDGRNGYTCQCDPDYSGTLCDRQCSGGADILFVVDVSGSIRRQRFVLLKQLIADIILQYDVDKTDSNKANFALVTFNDQATIQFHFNMYNSRQDAASAVLRVPYGGGRTNIADALEMAYNEVFLERNGKRLGIPSYMVIFTDGSANERKDDTINEAIKAKIAGIQIITASVGRTGELDQISLEAMASSPSSVNTLSVLGYSNIEDLRDMVIQTTCDDINECDTNPCGRSGTCINKYQDFYCECDIGVTGEYCSTDCPLRKDIVFMWDQSGSAEIGYYSTLLFLKQVVNGLDFNAQRMALATYNDDVTIRFNLKDYKERWEFLTNLVFTGPGGKTNTQLALQIADEQMFTDEEGDRSDGSNVLVLITDGKGNINNENTVDRALAMKRKGVSIYVVALGEHYDAEVNDVASSPSSTYVMNIITESDVLSKGRQFLQQICTRL